jgi:predicted nuclease of predicted toxin-antitoxin system
MKLLLDEHLSPRLAEALRVKGHDVICVIEIGLDGADDRIVWERAIAEERVLVSYDTGDFLTLFNLLFQESWHHPGLVVISTKTIPMHDFGGLERALDGLLTRAPDLADQIMFLDRMKN